MEEIKQSGEENPDEWNNLQLVKDDTELDQRKLQSKITEIESQFKLTQNLLKWLFVKIED